MNKQILYGGLIYLVTHIVIWFQSNSQFFNNWARDHSFLLSFLGVPVSYAFIIGNRKLVEGFEGMLWPSKLIGFAIGMIVMTIMTYLYMNQIPTPKTITTLVLAALIVIIQIFWK